MQLNSQKLHLLIEFINNIKVSILFGENEVRQYEENGFFNTMKDNVANYSFETEQEKKAFLLGLESALGWQDFVEISNH